MSKFVDRNVELSSLETRYMSGKTEFVIVYGRRRVERPH